MQKLIDVLNKLPRDADLKVGARTAFFYAGTVEDFTENLYEYSTECRVHADQLIERARAAIQAMLEKDTSPTAYALAQTHNRTYAEMSVNWEDYIGWVEQYFKQVKSCVNAVARTTREKALFVPLSEREVKSVGKADIEEGNCYNVIIEGYENGSYWLLSEAKESHISFVNYGSLEGKV